MRREDSSADPESFPLITCGFGPRDVCGRDIMSGEAAERAVFPAVCVVKLLQISSVKNKHYSAFHTKMPSYAA